jgi:hypothetical protein
MSTATSVSTSSTFSGLTWRAITGNNVDNVRIKLTFAGTSREISVLSGAGLDPLQDAVAAVVKKEIAANMASHMENRYGQIEG